MRMCSEVFIRCSLRLIALTITITTEGRLETLGWHDLLKRSHTPRTGEAFPVMWPIGKNSKSWHLLIVKIYGDGEISYTVHLEEIEPQIQGCQMTTYRKCTGALLCVRYSITLSSTLVSFNLKVIMIICVGIKSFILKIKKLRLRKIEHFEVTQRPSYKVRN